MRNLLKEIESTIEKNGFYQDDIIFLNINFISESLQIDCDTLQEIARDLYFTIVIDYELFIGITKK